MKSTSEWLVSFNSNYQSEIQSLVSERKLAEEKTTTISEKSDW